MSFPQFSVGVSFLLIYKNSSKDTKYLSIIFGTPFAFLHFIFPYGYFFCLPKL